MTFLKSFLNKYGHAIATGVNLASAAYLLAANGGKVTASTLLQALVQVAITQHARNAEPPSA